MILFLESCPFSLFYDFQTFSSCSWLNENKFHLTNLNDSVVLVITVIYHQDVQKMLQPES